MDLWFEYHKMTTRTIRTCDKKSLFRAQISADLVTCIIVVHITCPRYIVDRIWEPISAEYPAIAAQGAGFQNSLLYCNQPWVSHRNLACFSGTFDLECNRHRLLYVHYLGLPKLMDRICTDGWTSWRHPKRNTKKCNSVRCISKFILYICMYIYI